MSTKIIAIILMLLSLPEIMICLFSLAAKYSVSMYEYIWVNSHGSVFNKFVMYFSTKSDLEIYVYMGEGVCILLLGLALL